MTPQNETALPATPADMLLAYFNMMQHSGQLSEHASDTLKGWVVALTHSQPKEGERTDTERIDWLDKNKRHGGGAFLLQWTIRGEKDSANLRQAIDAAIAATPSGKGGQKP